MTVIHREGDHYDTVTIAVPKGAGPDIAHRITKRLLRMQAEGDSGAALCRTCPWWEERDDGTGWCHALPPTGRACAVSAPNFWCALHPGREEDGE